jgi:hypothetical protein
MPIRSRIELEVGKPESLHRTPDLLYALQLYLKGAALPFGPVQQRELRRDAAWLAADELGQQARAIEILRELFGRTRRTPSPAAAERYAALLEAQGCMPSTPSSTNAWPTSRAARQHGSGRAAVDARCRALVSAGSAERATSAYAQAAELGFDRALEALASAPGSR